MIIAGAFLDGATLYLLPAFASAAAAPENSPSASCSTSAMESAKLLVMAKAEVVVELEDGSALGPALLAASPSNDRGATVVVATAGLA